MIGATNLADTLDNALTRAGRFDRRVEVPLPDLRGRKNILDLYTKKIGEHLASDVDTTYLARGTIGFSGDLSLS